MRLLLVFLAVPVIEIALFIQVGGWIGLWPTLGLVILAAVAGIAIIRNQGLKALDRLRASVEADRDPSGPIANGAMILIAGILLLTPGFLTDALGLLLLLPPVRAAMFRRAAGTLRAGLVVTRAPAARGRPRGADTIDADYEVLDDVPPAQRGASGWKRSKP